jgi:hypothetical protein
MSGEPKRANIEVQEPLLEDTTKKRAPQSENSSKTDGETNNSHKQKPHELERKRTKSTYHLVLSLYKRCTKSCYDVCNSTRFYDFKFRQKTIRRN